MSNTISNTKIGKHRPVFTDTDIHYLARLLKLSYAGNLTKPPYHPDSPNDPDRGYDKVHEDYCLSLISKVGALDSKIKNGAATPAYTSNAIAPKDRLLHDLGGTTTPTSAHASAPTSMLGLPIPVRRLAAYELWYKHGPVGLTAMELVDANEYRFQNNLMEEKEAAIYEAKQWENAQ
jgi:hypothetical protein